MMFRGKYHANERVQACTRVPGVETMGFVSEFLRDISQKSHALIAWAPPCKLVVRGIFVECRVRWILCMQAHVWVCGAHVCPACFIPCAGFVEYGDEPIFIRRHHRDSPLQVLSKSSSLVHEPIIKTC
jgi:hypothetical protein